MMHKNGKSNVLFDTAAGAVAGGAATWLMDQATTALQERQTPALRKRERLATHGKAAYTHTVAKVARATNTKLTRKQEKRLGLALHWTLGVGMGALYGWLRHRRPDAAAGFGLLFGAAFFLVMDEGANPLLGITPGPRQFPWQTHARGLIGHLLFGATAESVLRGSDRLHAATH